MAEKKTDKSVAILHRVEELRKLRGMSQEELGEAIGRNKWFIQRLETGAQDLNLTTAYEIARKLRVDVSEVLAVTTSASTEPGVGFSEDIKRFNPIPSDRISVPTDVNRHLYRVETDSCANAGIRKGDVVEIDIDVKAVRTVQMGDIVVVLYHPPGEKAAAKELLRQFMPPNLLITNAPRGENARSIDLSIEDAQIVGILIGSHRNRGSGGN